MINYCWDIREGLQGSLSSSLSIRRHLQIIRTATAIEFSSPLAPISHGHDNKIQTTKPSPKIRTPAEKQIEGGHTSQQDR